MSAAPELTPEEAKEAVTAGSFRALIKLAAILIGVVVPLVTGSYYAGLAQADSTSQAIEARVADCDEARERARDRAVQAEAKADACYEARLELAGMCRAVNALSGAFSGDE